MADKVAGFSEIKAGASSVSLPVRLLSTAGAGVTGKTASSVTASYWRQGGTRTAISVSDLAAVNSAYSSGGLKEVDSTNLPGLYRLDIPDAAVASGADWVVIGLVVSGAVDYQVFIPLASQNAAGIATDYTSSRAAKLDNLDATVSSRSSHTAANVRTEMDANSTKLANLDATVSSRLASASYTTPPTAAAITDAVWDELVSDHTTSGTTGAALNRIGSGQITTTSVVAQSGNVTTIAGDDYSNTDSRAIDWTDASVSWPDLTGASILVTVKSGTTTLMSKAGSVVTPTGSSKKVRVQPTAADTRAIPVGTYEFDVQATLSNGHIVTLLRGMWNNQADYS